MTMACEEGLILAIEDRSAAPGPDPPSDAGTTHRFHFLHDRIQQAAFDCIADDAKKEFRLQIGRRLMAGLGPDDELVPQPDVLSNLNYAWELISDEEERQRWRASTWWRDAGPGKPSPIRMRLATSRSVSACSAREAWQNRYELAFELHSEAFECEYLTANFERADQLFKALIANARSKLDKARIYRTKILLDTSEERYEQAIAVGIEALRLSMSATSEGLRSCIC